MKRGEKDDGSQTCIVLCGLGDQKFRARPIKGPCMVVFKPALPLGL